ncbi:MAG: hypothetical protein AAGD13_24185 [Pseudomonadota bacterium]
MGWPFDAASWDVAEGAYYSAVGSELIWLIVSVVMCLAAMFVGSKHELDAYRKAED